jgi:hypothetical protein
MKLKLVLVATAGLMALLAAGMGAARVRGGMTTIDGVCDISRIAVDMVYFLPADRREVPDWRERLEYFARRLEQFQTREFGTQSVLTVQIRAAPLRTAKTAAQIRGDDGDVVFWKTIGEAKATMGAWPAQSNAFPILLVMSDINWRELDDFRREIMVDGRPQHEGHVSAEGRHFPGAASGGARAVYHPGDRAGYALVSADGWRVPYTGSDCVVYHEGVGHPIGLNHPEPADGSVMSLAQYMHPLNRSWVDGGQKRKLGWTPAGAKPATAGLFSAFTALHEPAVPRPGEPVEVRLTWPAGVTVKSVEVAYQTDLFGPWVVLSPAALAADASRVDLGRFDAPTPVSYRVKATLTDGRFAEFWSYFQVRDATTP